jgi:hypothetical protein
VRRWLREDDPFFTGGRANINERDRWDADRDEVLRQALDAWRINPLARRIVGLTTQYVVGAGFSVNCKHEQGTAILFGSWMQHPLNRHGNQNIGDVRRADPQLVICSF